MKQLKHSLKVDKIKDTQYSGGNVCITSDGKYLFCIHAASVNIIDISTGNTVNSLDSEEEEITCITLSPNDKHLITAHKNLLLKQWDNWHLFENNYNIENENDKKKSHSSTSKCTRTWKAIHSAQIQFMCFDTTSTLLATASSDYTTKIWDIQAQYCTHNLKGAQGLIRCVSFYPEIELKQQLITGSDDGKLRIYNLNTSNMEACLEGHFSAITAFEYLKNENTSNSYDRLLSSSRDKILIIWDIVKYVKIRTIPIYESIETILIDTKIVTVKNERYVITMGNEGLLKIWDLNTSRNLFKQNEKESLKVLSKKENEIGLVIVQSIYDKKNNSLILVTSDQLIIFVRIDLELFEKLVKQNSLDDDEYLKLFKVYKQFIGDHGEILDTQFCNSKENLLALATNSEFLKIYDLNTWDCKLLRGHTDLIICLASFCDKNTNESYLASSSKDNTIRIWKLKELDDLNYTFECISICQGHTQDVGALSFSKLSLDYLVSGSIDTTIKLWKIVENRNSNKNKDENEFKINVLFTVKAHDKDINSVTVSPNDKMFASCSTDKTAKIWDSSNGTCLAILRGHKRGIWSIQFSPIDQLIATSSADATIKIWSLNDFSCIKTLEGHNTSVLKVYFLNHGTQLISSGSNGLIKIWNIKENECVGTFDEHDNKAWALCVNKEESRFISGGADGKLIIWKDVTEEIYEEELAKREEVLLKEQELNNYLKEKKWKKALKLAILLDKPFGCYEIIKKILQESEFYNDDQDFNSKNTKAKKDLERTLLQLRDDQIKTLLKYANDWNTNTKYCHFAQIVFELILKNYPPELVVDHSNFEFASLIIEQFLPYSERHYARLKKLNQQIMFIDFAWQNMKLDDKNNKNF